MALTETQLELLRDYISDPDTGSPVFDDNKLNLYYTESGDSLVGTRLIVTEILLSDAAKFADYTQNQSSEKKSQVFNNLLKVRALLAAKLAEETAGTITQIRLSGIRTVPQRRKDSP